MRKKSLPASTYSRVDWLLIAGIAGLLFAFVLRGLALYDRLVGLHY